MSPSDKSHQLIGTEPTVEKLDAANSGFHVAPWCAQPRVTVSAVEISLKDGNVEAFGHIRFFFDGAKRIERSVALNGMRRYSQ